MSLSAFGDDLDTRRQRLPVHNPRVVAACLDLGGKPFENIVLADYHHGSLYPVIHFFQIHKASAEGLSYRLRSEAYPEDGL